MICALLVCEEEEDCIDCGEHPASDKSEDDSGAGHDGVVLEGCGDVKEPHINNCNLIILTLIRSPGAFSV